MNDAVYDKLREARRRRPLTSAEDAELREYLAAHPDAREDWRMETALTETMRRLPDVPVASNFSSRVLRAAESVAAARQWRARRPGWLRRWDWLPRRHWLHRTALAVALLSFGTVYTHQYYMGARVELARSVSVVSSVTALPPLEWLEDFETINRLGSMPPVDYELLALLE